ncbi:methyltransferase domain-containing protein [Francisella hispaniensis]|uniref:biotin synthase n=1 Tax=Francisella hispaniensis TaxID=622488 RepID=UPI001903CA35|nr:biotin synthase [Francisella hispaniensis]MBK2356746.1 biotin synthase [Francisella hispaniensis]
MDIYDQVRSNFAKATEYSKNSTIQNQVRQLLLEQTLNYSRLVNYNHIDIILNLGVRDLSEPLELNKIFSPNQIDACDIALSKNSYSISSINMLKLNFDKDLRLLRNDYDLIFSNMSFQWSQNTEKLIRNLSKKLNNRAILAFSTVLDNNFHQIKDILRINKMHSSYNILDFIRKSNLNCLHHEDLYLDLRFNNFRELANHLKSTGVNTYTGDDNKDNFSNIRKLCLNSSHINLSYHIGLFICFKE